MTNALDPGETITGETVDGQPTPAPDLSALIRTPADPSKTVSDLSKAVAPLREQESQAKERVLDRTSAALDADAVRQHHAFDAEVATSHDIPDWNEQQERQKFSTDPVKAFGSAGSIFAMIASAFTHRPMINALQGSAAAMTAIKEGDDKEYDRAFTAYKTNVDLALKRHDMMHQEYADAMELMKTDISAGKAAFDLAAAKYDDKIMLFLSQNGMDDKVVQAIETRSKAAEQLTKQQDEDMNFQFKKAAYQSIVQDLDKSGLKRDDPRRLAIETEAGRRIWAGKDTELSDQMVQWEIAHVNDNDGKGPTPEEKADFYNKIRLTATGLRTGTGGTPTKAKDIEQGVLAERQQAIASGQLDPKDAKAVNDFDAKTRARLTAESGSITPNRRDQLTSQSDRFVYADQTIDKIEALLKKHNALTGLGGKITRPGEVVANWFGDNEADRHQFESDINLLREWSSRLLNESQTRPLSAEESRIVSIVPGLEMGATTANTASRLMELKKLFKQMKAGIDARIGAEGASQQPASPPETSAPPTKAPSWDDFPAVSPRSDAGGNGRVLSDATTESVSGGQNYAAANPPLQISQRPNGQYAVIIVATGQTVYVGSLDGARNVQASGTAAIRRSY